MQSAIVTPTISSPVLWTGRVLSGALIAFLVFDAVIKLVPLQVVIDTTAALGFPPELARTLGVLTLICTALYAWPRTAILGAILLTGYLGGAIAIHLRISNPLFSHTLFGVYLGLMAWGGLYLRDERLRALIPFRR
ncbi:DoxX family protein [Aminobacter sp. AP02]|uniref:DoxX family protein n=1 Tax=Aminobacter sp. AP02 TaxID=2135737 RepID=UPI000D6BA224|nr:DoxX family protein [Aminobacter sp. AP02]PWK68515.1 DoxX-like protein [Aminobacter sp. AP02]